MIYRRFCGERGLLSVEWNVVVPTKVVIVAHAKPSINIVFLVGVIDRPVSLEAQSQVCNRELSVLNQSNTHTLIFALRFEDPDIGVV